MLSLQGSEPMFSQLRTVRKNESNWEGAPCPHYHGNRLLKNSTQQPSCSWPQEMQTCCQPHICTHRRSHSHGTCCWSAKQPSPGTRLSNPDPAFFWPNFNLQRTKTAKQSFLKTQLCNLPKVSTIQEHVPSLQQAENGDAFSHPQVREMPENKIREKKHSSLKGKMPSLRVMGWLTAMVSLRGKSLYLAVAATCISEAKNTNKNRTVTWSRNHTVQLYRA